MEQILREAQARSANVDFRRFTTSKLLRLCVI
jgi:hypothetical protein